MSPLTATPPDGPIVEATVLSVTDDVCELDLGQRGRGRLKQDYSRAWKEDKPLEQLPAYQKGERLRVYLYRRHQAMQLDFWYLHERWAWDNPWANLEQRLPKGSLVTGTVHDSAGRSWLVQLDEPDILAWLYEKEIPWSDGGTGDAPTEKRAERLSIELGDRIQAQVSGLRPPPEFPAISINRLLERRTRGERVESTDEEAPEFQVGYRAHGDALSQLRSRLLLRQPLEGYALLLVDDDADSLTALADLLRLNGATVETLLSHDYRSLTDLVTAMQARLAGVRLVLVDYSLPRQGEGLAVARRLKTLAPEQAIALYTGEVADMPQGDVADSLAGVMRKPIRLDSLLRCLQGEAVWEVEGLAPLDTHIPVLTSPTETPESLLREWRARESRLRYLVVLRPLSQSRLVRELVTGEFPEGERLDELVRVTDLHRMLKGYRHEFSVSPTDKGNAELKRLCAHARFLALGRGSPPPFIFGIGWHGEVPFEETQLQAFVTLLRARLEQAGLLRWVQEQLPFMVLGQVFAGLGHEVRNRFAPWVNHQQTLRLAWERYRASDGATQQAVAAQMAKSLLGMESAYGNLRELVDLMLTRLKSRDGGMQFGEVLADVRKLFEPQLRQKGIRYIAEGEAPEYTLGLPVLYLVQPLSNLLLNVHKHMHREHDGWVKVACHLSVDGRALEVAVEDNGPGIPEAVRPRLFEPGFSLAPKPEERTGMGLYVSRLLLGHVGGSLELDWAWRGVGSRFVLRLPMQLEGS